MTMLHVIPGVPRMLLTWSSEQIIGYQFLRFQKMINMVYSV